MKVATILLAVAALGAEAYVQGGARLFQPANAIARHPRMQSPDTRNQQLTDTEVRAKTEAEVQVAVTAKQEGRRILAARPIDVTPAADEVAELLQEELTAVFDEAVDLLPVTEEMWEDLAEFEKVRVDEFMETVEAPTIDALRHKHNEVKGKLEAMTPRLEPRRAWADKRVLSDKSGLADEVSTEGLLTVDWSSAVDALIENDNENKLAAAFERRANLRQVARAEATKTATSTASSAASLEASTTAITVPPEAGIDLDELKTTLVQWGQAAPELAGPVAEKVAIIVRDTAVATVATAALFVRDEVGRSVQAVQDDVQARVDYLVETPTRVRNEAEAMAERVAGAPAHLLGEITAARDELIGTLTSTPKKLSQGAASVKEELKASPAKLELAAKSAKAEIVKDVRSLPQLVHEVVQNEVKLYESYPGKLSTWVEQRAAHLMRTEVSMARGKLDAAHARKSRMQREVEANKLILARKTGIPTSWWKGKEYEGSRPQAKTAPGLHELLTGGGLALWKAPAAETKAPAPMISALSLWKAPAAEKKAPTTIRGLSWWKATEAEKTAPMTIGGLSWWKATEAEVAAPTLSQRYDALRHFGRMEPQAAEKKPPPPHFLAKMGSGRSWWKEI